MKKFGLSNFQYILFIYLENGLSISNSEFWDPLFSSTKSINPTTKMAWHENPM